MRKRGSRLFILLLIAALGVFVCLAAARKRNKDAKVPVCLNKTLTNEMSDTSDLHGLDAQIRKYMQEWNLHGASLTIMKNDSLVYAKGYGEADDGVEMGPGTILRVASVSKLITAIGIMTLEEQGLLDIDDKVFDEGGLLSGYSDVIKDKRMFDITIRHLLMHQAGFTTRAGDPMFNTRDLISIYKWDGPPDSATLARKILSRKLGFAPGSGSDYSNFGYLLLSMVIENATGMEYEEWMQENVLKKAGCLDAHLAFNYYEDKFPNETRYYLQNNDKEIPCYDGSGALKPRCYGGNDIRALKGAGAWVISTPELAKLVASVDGRQEVPDILSEESVKAMTFVTDSVTYALGWNDISKDGIWTRTGTLSGTSALIKYYPDGECWIMVTNTSTWRGPYFTKWTSSLFRRLREKYSDKLPQRDFFYR